MASNQYNNIADLCNLSLEKINEIVIDVRAMMEDVQATITSLERVAGEKEEELEELQEMLDKELYIPGAQINPELISELDSINERINLNRQKYLYCVGILENMTTLRQIKIIHKYGTTISLPADSFVTELENYINDNSRENVQIHKIGFKNSK